MQNIVAIWIKHNFHLKKKKQNTKTVLLFFFLIHYKKKSILQWKLSKLPENMLSFSTDKGKKMKKANNHKVYQFNL